MSSDVLFINFKPTACLHVTNHFFTNWTIRVRNCTQYLVANMAINLKRNHTPNNHETEVCFYQCSYSPCEKKFKNIGKFQAHKRFHIKSLSRLI